MEVISVIVMFIFGNMNEKMIADIEKLKDKVREAKNGNN